LPGSLTALTELHLPINLLSSFTLPGGLTNLTTLDLFENALTSFTLPSGLTALTNLNLGVNQLTNLTIPADATNLTTLFLGFNNQLTNVVLPEPLAATNLAALVASLRDQGVSVFTYSLTVQLISPRRTEAGDFEFTLTGPPGVYTIFASVDLTTWNELGATTNILGSAVFTDSTASLSARKFYRASQ
jgi:hypothetical protein